MASYKITPVPAPRMTQSDRWKKRDCVMRYFAFRDEVKKQHIELPDSSHVVFIMPMPPSWSEKKRIHMNGQPHRQRPDIDNIFKALGDSVYAEDCQIHDMRITKYWGLEGEIIITPLGV